jgi:hypothetical protein
MLAYSSCRWSLAPSFCTAGTIRRTPCSEPINRHIPLPTEAIGFTIYLNNSFCCPEFTPTALTTPNPHLYTAAPEWACSPPNTLNPACPAHLAGDPRCSETYCPPFAGCASSTCNARLGNLVADSVVALDAYAVKGEQCALSTVSLPECCSLCRSTRGCNAWSFCNAEGGCGKGCNSAKHGFAAGLLANPW